MAIAEVANRVPVFLTLVNTVLMSLWFKMNKIKSILEIMVMP